MARIAGTDPEAPGLLLDVAPPDWSVPSFSGEVRDGVPWGRGAVDMKNADAILLAVVRNWARTGWLKVTARGKAEYGAKPNSAKGYTHETGT